MRILNFNRFRVFMVVVLISVLIWVSLGLFNRPGVSEIYIKVTGHAFASHGPVDVNEAFNCMRKNGTSAVMSEKNSRNLHWLCVDPITLTVYDVITTYLTKTIDHPAGEAKLITAYKPESTMGQAVLKWYVEHLGATKEAILVNLRAFPGNIFFGP